VFGTTVQSLITVQNKIWEGLAARKAVLTGDAPMLREVLVPGRDLWVCPRADPAALAAAIRVLYRDPALRARLAESGHRLIQEHYTVAHTGRRLRDALEEVRRHRR
jgi:glycosyltransferase involved in cell wall biosynthesis